MTAAVTKIRCFLTYLDASNEMHNQRSLQDLGSEKETILAMSCSLLHLSMKAETVKV